MPQAAAEQPNNQMIVADTASDKVEIMQALKMRFKNKNTFQEIGDYFGVSRQAVHDKIQKVIGFIDDPAITEQYENNKADILSSAERVLLGDMLDVERRKKASLNNVAYAYQAVANQNRLTRGQATEISGYSDMTGKESEIEAELSKLRAMVLPSTCEHVPDDALPQDVVCQDPDSIPSE